MFCSVNAQESYRLMGKVYDEKENAIVIGDILLYNKTETELVQYTILSDGFFELTNIAAGSYVLKISSLGYEDKSLSIEISKDISLEFVLTEQVSSLEEVEVTAVKNPITNSNGNLKLDVQNPVFSSIPELLDVLAKLPTVQIAANRESVSVLGKGNPLIYLGNQRIDFQEFTSLAVNTIESIELINNPSARYEASGRAVIKVTLKRDASSNTVTFTEIASIRRNFNNYLSTSGNMNLGRSNFRGNFSYNQLGQWESNTFRFEIPERNVLVDYLVLVSDNKRREFNGGVGWYLPFKKEGYISLNSNFRLQTNDAPIFTETFLRDGLMENDIFTNTDNNRERNYVTVNFNFEKPLTKNLNLFTGLQFSNYLELYDSNISNNIDDSSFTLDEARTQKYRISSLAFRTDFTHKISANTTWELGLNWNEAKAQAVSDFQDLRTDDFTSVDFGYDEGLYAAYTSFASKLGKKVDYSVGLRLEHNQVKSGLETEEIPLVERKTTNLFPKMNVSIPLDSTKTISLNYAKSVSRPNFSRTNTISLFINPFLEGAGNINLLPSMTDEVSTNLQWKNKSLAVGYNRTKRPMNFTIGYDEEADVAILSQVNLEKESGFFSNLTLPFSKGIWSTTNTIALYYNKIEDNNAVLGVARPYIYAYSNHQFKIAKDMTVAFGVWALTRRQEGIFKRNTMIVPDTIISKTFFKKWECSLRFNDFFRAMNFEEAYAIDGVFAEGTYFADGREMALTIRYRFGDDAKNDFKSRDVDENLDRIN